MADAPEPFEHETPHARPVPVGFQVESERWRVERSEGGTLLLRDVRARTTMEVGEHDALVELANLLLLGTDVLDGTPPTDMPRVDFVAADQMSACLSLAVVYSMFGQPPARGDVVTLPDGVSAKVNEVRRTYRRNGPTTITVYVSTDGLS
jgi:hypothetical protein